MQSSCWKALDEMREEGNICLITAVDGESAGSHSLYLDGNAVWRDPAFPSEAVFKKNDMNSGIPHLVEKNDGRFFIEYPGRRKRAVVCGCGHVASALIRVLKLTGFEVTCLEDRLSFAKKAEEAGADRVLTGSYRENLRHIEPDPSLFYIVMTRGHRFDMECLEEILGRDFRYAGMMSSKVRSRAARELMRERGIAEEKLGMLHAPVGLEIGAETPAEIAVSVASQMIQVLHGDGDRYFSGDIIRAMAEEGCDRVAAVIVRRRGPAPRDVGTRMVIFADGRTTGTIGGGCQEAEVIAEARRMMQLSLPSSLKCVDLTGQSGAGDDGMACGGKIDVLLEHVPVRT